MMCARSLSRFLGFTLSSTRQTPKMILVELISMSHEIMNANEIFQMRLSACVSVYFIFHCSHTHIENAKDKGRTCEKRAFSHRMFCCFTCCFFCIVRINCCLLSLSLECARCSACHAKLNHSPTTSSHTTLVHDAARYGYK